MALQLDELLVKKKEQVQILDLSKSTANNAEDLRKLLEKVPEFKIKLEKIKPEDIRLKKIKKHPFRAPKRELKPKPCPFVDPIPSEMKSLRLDDLWSVDIQWRMLTSLRPKSKLDEEYFSKLIEIGKLQITAREEENKTPLKNFARKSKNRIGIDESKFISCRACGEEFCSAEVCSQFAYDFFERVATIESTSQEETSATMAALDDNEIYRKKRKKGRKFAFFSTRKRKLQARSAVKPKGNTVRVNTSTKNVGDRAMSKQDDSERKSDKNLQSQIKQPANRIVKRKSKTYSYKRVGKKEKIN